MSIRVAGHKFARGHRVNRARLTLSESPVSKSGASLMVWLKSGSYAWRAFQRFQANTGLTVRTARTNDGKDNIVGHKGDERGKAFIFECMGDGRTLSALTDQSFVQRWQYVESFAVSRSAAGAGELSEKAKKAARLARTAKMDDYLAREAHERANEILRQFSN